MKSFQKKNWYFVVGVLVVVVIAVCVFLTIKNWKQPGFVSASLTDIVTVLLGLVISFFVTERLTDRRRRNDCIEHIIVEIETFVSDENNFALNKSALLHQASCANRIKYLKDANFPDIKDDINFIEVNFRNIRDLYSNHSQNEESLQNVKVDIDKHRNNIVDKCSKIRVELYSFH